MDLSGNKLTTLPASFGQLKSLVWLNLNFNELSVLPASFGQLSAMKECQLANNQLTTLPEGFGNLHRLESLLLSRNKFQVFPAGISSLVFLKSLDLSENKLTSLPAEIKQWQNLNNLNVRNNQLAALPNEIGQLTHLEELYLGENQLTALPASICNLNRLTTLSTTKNPIQSRPDCMKGMKAKAPMFETLTEAVMGAQSEDDYLKIAGDLLRSENVKAYEKIQERIKKDSTNASLYFSLSYYALFAKDYPAAIAAAQKTLQLDPKSIKVETNLALGYLLNNEYAKAEKIYKKWKGKKFDAADEENANAIFLKDIAELEEVGITHKDFEKVKKLMEK